MAQYGPQYSIAGYSLVYGPYGPYWAILPLGPAMGTRITVNVYSGPEAHCTPAPRLHAVRVLSLRRQGQKGQRG